MLKFEPFSFALQNIYGCIKNNEYYSLVVDAISGRHFTLSKINELISFVDNAYLSLQNKDDELIELEANYNKSYPAQHPDDLKNSFFYIKKIRSEVKTCTKLMGLLSPIYNLRKERYEKWGIPYPSKYAKSYLCKNSVRQFTLDLKGQFRPEVYELVYSIERFINLFIDDIELCIKLMKEEISIGRSYTLSKELYDKCFNEVEEEFEEVQDLLNSSNFKPENNPIIKARLEYDNFEDFVKAMLHKFTPSQMKRLFYAILIGVCKPLDCSNEELQESYQIEKNDNKELFFYRNSITETLIKEFNDFVPPLKRGELTKIIGETLALFALAVEVIPTQTDILKFHQYFISKYDGGLRVCSYTSFQPKIAKLYSSDKYKKMETYIKFKNRIKELKQKVENDSKIIKLSAQSQIRS